MKRKQRPNVSLLLWLSKEFIILSILSNLVCTALYMAGSWLLTGTPLPASQSSGLGPLLFLICSTVILGCGLNYRFNQFLTGLAGGLRGVAEGNFSLRLDPRRAGPLAAAYEDFNKMAEELQGVQTLREDFINSFSHEFKTPITAVSGFAELLQEPGLTEEERSQYLQIIAEEAHRLANLANSTLLMSRLESHHSIPEKEPFSLDEQIKRCTILLSSAWEKKRIAFSADLEPVSYVGNEELMRHVWINLLNNAIKFTPEGGEVSITLQCSPEQIQVQISDTGIGMSPEMISHIFDQYYQGEPNHTEKGLGLGLSIVHRIVELCGGQIQVDSIPDQGSVFTVLLPRSR